MILKRSTALLAFFAMTVFPQVLIAGGDPGWEELDNWAASETSSDTQVSTFGQAETSSETASPDLPARSDISPSGTVVAPVSRSATTRLVQPALIQSAPSRTTTSTPPKQVKPQSETSTAVTGYSFTEMKQVESSAERQASARKRIASPTPEIQEEPRPRNVFAEQFFMNPDQRLLHQTSEVDGFVFVETPGPGGRPEYALVTGFGGSVIRTQKVGRFEDLYAARKWIRDNLETQTFEGAEVRKLKVTDSQGVEKELFWVGNKSFPSAERAFAEIAMTKAAVETSGGDFSSMVKEAQSAVSLPEEKPAVEITPAEYEKQEKVVLKMLDAMDVGNKLFGPFQGEPSGEPIIWQSFGETSWRLTNLDAPDYDTQVGFWTNRILFKGIRAPLSTIDPFVEATVAMESNGVDFKNNMKLWAGLEWRPFSRNPWLLNYRPWGIPLLEWVRNYRFYVMYGERINLKEDIGGGSADTDLNWGVQIFYEWGVDLPPPGEGPPNTIPDYLRRYVWGEYFGNYRWEKTNFGIEDDFDALILNSSIVLGVRLPGIPLPPNPINDEFVLMPYMRFEHVNNTRFSFPFQNQYFVGAGVRWMPFRTYRYKENEWLSKFKVFGEYVGVGLVQHAKQDGEAPNATRYDWRVGVSMSSRRF